MPEPAALAGVRIVDLTRLLPGPVTTWILARLGAEVIKIEAPGAPDWLRFTPPLIDGVQPAYRQLNEDKRHIVLDIRKPDALEAFHRVLEGADVLVEQFRPGVLARLGADPAALVERHRRLIVASITGYGQSGPFSQRAGHDLNYIALTGLLGRTAGGLDPVQPPWQAADVAGGGYIAALAILAALQRRHTSGRGGHIDVSMAEGVLPLSILAASTAAAGIPTEQGGAPMLEGREPYYRTYVCADGGRISLGALEPKFWARLCEAVERPDWAARQLGGGTLTDELEALFASKTRDEWMEILGPADCCAEPVLAHHELAEHPHHQARGVFTDGRVRVPVLEELGAHVRSDADITTGGQTRAVLLENGFSPDEIDALLASGAASEA